MTRRALRLFGGLLLAVLAGTVACEEKRVVAPPPPVEIARVEPVYDVPREYRRHSLLPCTEGTGLVYVVTAERLILSFQPRSVQFRAIGRLQCPVGASPNSMAVDRAGGGWVHFRDGTLFLVNLHDASCRAADLAEERAPIQVGMAYATTGRDLTAESLFIAVGTERGKEIEAPGLHRVEGDKIVPIGPFTGRLRGYAAELTGTGDGRLFGFFATKPATLAQIDPVTGAITSERALPQVETGAAWAFAFWGGSFYFFWAPYGKTSRVSRIGPDGQLVHLAQDLGIRIVGAGVSTCAPTSG